MSSFTDTLVVEKVGPHTWKTYREFTYEVGELGSGENVTIPQGFITDFASVPRAFWIILPPDGQYCQAAVLHDYLYNTRIYTRQKSDHIFLEAMAVLGVNFFVRHIMYRAVRMFGWMCWNKKEK